jgi:hypothetical protein
LVNFSSVPDWDCFDADPDPYPDQTFHLVVDPDQDIYYLSKIKENVKSILKERQSTFM